MDDVSLNLSSRSLESVVIFFYCLQHFISLLGTFGKIGKLLLISSCLSVWNNLDSTGRIFIKFHVCIIFENLSRNHKFH
jgi:hypothetical protein